MLYGNNNNSLPADIMTKKVKWLRALAVVLIAGAASLAFGREMLLSAFAENEYVENGKLDKNEEREDYATAYTERLVLERLKMSVNKGDLGDLPFLCRGIKYKCREEGEYLCYYNTNQRMLYNVLTEICVYYSYNCTVGECKKSIEECEKIATRGLYSAFSNVGTPRIFRRELVSSDEKQCTFSFEISKRQGESITVCIRRDTGSVVLFDALNVHDVSYTVKYGIV